MALQEKVKINTANGLHARPITQIVSTAAKLSSDIKIIYKDVKADAKSMIALMKLGVRQYEEVTIQVDGEEEAKDFDRMMDILKKMN
ncbi:HPr family phosphocarrier protein [Niallia sp. 03133]|uniref:HPr family phosphocarrier protein n=1 Tax=Niallia sp. 03133 TaxID=3458060 RepID=UPI0040447293